MEISITPFQDSENSNPPVVRLAESSHGRLMIKLQDPERELYLDHDEFRRAYNAIFPDKRL